VSVAPADDDLFDLAPCGYALVGAGGVLVRTNAELHRLTGRGAGELVGSTLGSLFTVGGRIFLETHLAPLLGHDGSLREIALDLLRPDGTRIPVLLNADLSVDTDGGPVVRLVLVETQERHRYEHDLLTATRTAEEALRSAVSLANTLQETLVPPTPPSVPDLAVAACYRPAGDGSVVGGDFYDVFQVAPDDWCVALGDVSGKGVSAATVTSFVRYTVRALAIDHEDPSDLLAHLDRAMHAHHTDHYCTLVLGRLRRAPGQAWTLHLALAGHPAALVRHPEGTVTELGSPGTPVGLVDSTWFETVRHELGAETIVFYTDGVTDARGPQGMYGEEQLRALLRELPGHPEPVAEGITHHSLDFQAGVASDDIAVVAFAAEPVPTSAGALSAP
jgi:sigma-B regulation protein RsbU (phosphoserine phosphatase)